MSVKLKVLEMAIQSNHKFKVLGNAKEKIPVIGIGTKGIYDYRLAEEALIHAFNLGLTLVEVSEAYGDGLAEELIGRVIKRFKRDEIYIVLRVNAVRFSSLETVVKAINGSLQRLNLAYVDIVVADGLNEIVGLSTQVKILESLIDKGVTRYIGLANLKLKDLSSSIQMLSKYNIDVIQYKYNVLDKRVEKDILKFSIENNITFLACSPLEKGAVLKNSRLIYLSSKYKKTPIQVALNYLISKSTVVPTPKAERKAHIDEIYGALGWNLNVEDMRYLEKI
jgi:diketogulonate reductase-like aldo/keto reductase